MSKSVWFAYGKTESGDYFQVGAWGFEPSASTVAEVILEKYDWLIEPEYVYLPAEEACEESLIYWDIVQLEILE